MATLKMLPFLALHAHLPTGRSSEEQSAEDLWWRCSVEAWFEEPPRTVRVPLWVRGRQARRFLERGLSQCHHLARTLTGQEVCKICRWFDSSEPSDLSKPGLSQASGNVSAESCASGMWADDASAWLKRDKLVHKQRYVGACLPEDPEDNWTLQATYLGWAALAASGCYFVAQCFPSCRLSGRVDPDDSDERAPRRPREPPWVRLQRSVPPKEDSPGPSPTGSASPSSPPFLPDLDVPVHCGPEAASIIESIDRHLAASISFPGEERKQIMRKYLMRWHPDKNQDQAKETTSAVIQHLYARKAWFVEGAALHETAPLLP